MVHMEQTINNTPFVEGFNEQFFNAAKKQKNREDVMFSKLVKRRRKEEFDFFDQLGIRRI